MTNIKQETQWANTAEFEMLRERGRKNKKRITFDCQNARYYQGDVICAKTSKLTQKSDLGVAPLLSVLKGVLYSACVGCKHYE